MNPFTILLVKSETWLERWLFGKYKDAAISIQIENMTGVRKTNCVFARHKGRWQIVADFNHWRKGKELEPISLKYLQTKEKSHDDFLEVFGRTQWMGTTLTPPKAIAKIFLGEGWKKATYQTLLDNQFSK
jgi:hypothetical protein